MGRNQSIPAHPAVVSQKGSAASWQVFVGLVVRDHLMVLLRTAMLRGSASSLDVTYEELNRQFVSAAARSLITEQQMAVLQVNTWGAS